uniref:Uncharacterized protein n=1 Tax=Romanomermis culicivorax TaxID=13658 RepID=A0A915K0P2_ROMCU
MLIFPPKSSKFMQILPAAMHSHHGRPVAKCNCCKPTRIKPDDVDYSKNNSFTIQAYRLKKNSNLFVKLQK